MRVLVRFCLSVFFLAGWGSATAQVSVPAAATFQLNGGKLDLGGSDLQLGGTLTLGSGGLANAASVLIGAGGLLDAGSGALSLFGNWSNLGSFVPGGSTTNFIDGPLATATFTGSTTFHIASFVSATGKNYLFPVARTQYFDALTILGTAATGIQFRSTAPGQVAYVSLLASGPQNIDFVGVSNVHAIGQPLAPTKTNDGGSGDAFGWFGLVFTAVPAPMLGWIGLLLLTLALVGSVARLRRSFR
ncbi:MAG: hypothetical protein JSR65_09945 [Proteobacteria bacterium]|nr:hypothetical protein [Pseudomonadota bacterium]